MIPGRAVRPTARVAGTSVVVVRKGGNVVGMRGRGRCTSPHGGPSTAYMHDGTGRISRGKPDLERENIEYARGIRENEGKGILSWDIGIGVWSFFFLFVIEGAGIRAARVTHKERSGRGQSRFDVYALV